MKKILSKSKWLLHFTFILAIMFSSTEPVFAVANAASSAAGNNHSLILKNDGTVWAWGKNDYGQLGDGSTAQRGVPIQVKDLTNVTRIAAGDGFSLSLKSTGTVWAWGKNEYGQIGDGTSGSSHYKSWPVKVNNIANIVAIAGGSNHSLALDVNGNVYSWGYNNGGQLGDGSGVSYQVNPVQVNGLTNIIEIASGSYANHSLALKKDGSVYAWGLNSNGQVGDGTTTNAQTPKLITKTKP